VDKEKSLPQRQAFSIAKKARAQSRFSGRRAARLEETACNPILNHNGPMESKRLSPSRSTATRKDLKTQCNCPNHNKGK
jgi:hypothetical protein